MSNPETIEIHGLKTIHKLCNFGADRGMEGCSFAEIVECMFAELAKSQAVPEGFVLMPIKPTETMVMAVVKEHEGDAFLPYSLYDAYVKQAMIEAQEQSHESE